MKLPFVSRKRYARVVAAARLAHSSAIQVANEKNEAIRLANRHARELGYLYDELGRLQRKGASGLYITQLEIARLAARRNPEGRTYEGPEKTQ